VPGPRPLQCRYRASLWWCFAWFLSYKAAQNQAWLYCGTVMHIHIYQDKPLPGGVA
jgi:hypothetical protein